MLQFGFMLYFYKELEYIHNVQLLFSQINLSVSPIIFI